MTKKKYLIVIAGPTAVGKTSLSIDLAKRYQSEIISADSRQFFKELEIGTAKPTPLELKEIRHHFINNLSIHDTYDAGKFAKEAEAVLKQLFANHDVVFLVGGSGLYIKALCDGLDEMPHIPSEIRTSLNSQLQSEGLDLLLSELEKSDPEYFQQVDKKNGQRVVRALEVIRTTGMPYSAFRKGNNKVEKDYNVIKIALEDKREDLYERINSRMDQMIADGLFEEAKKFYVYKDLPALQTVGYSEIFKYIDREYDKEEAIRLLKRNSRRYAKRQLTWFKKDADFKWFKTDNCGEIVEYIEKALIQ